MQSTATAAIANNKKSTPTRAPIEPPPPLLFACESVASSFEEVNVVGTAEGEDVGFEEGCALCLGEDGG